MTSSNIVVPLIQLVALFLPAWAVVIQVLSKMLDKVELEEDPVLIPVFGLGFSLSATSLLLFGWSANSILLSISQSTVARNSGPVADALTGIGLGGLAFSWLGVILLLILGFQYTSYPEGHYVNGLAVIYSMIMVVGWELDKPILTMMSVLAVVAISTFILTSEYHRQPTRGAEP